MNITQTFGADSKFLHDILVLMCHVLPLTEVDILFPRVGTLKCQCGASSPKAGGFNQSA